MTSIRELNEIIDKGNPNKDLKGICIKAIAKKGSMKIKPGCTYYLKFTAIPVDEYNIVVNVFRLTNNRLIYKTVAAISNFEILDPLEFYDINKGE